MTRSIIQNQDPFTVSKQMKLCELNDKELKKKSSKKCNDLQNTHRERTDRSSEKQYT